VIVRNPNIANLKAGYLFPEISRRCREFAATHPSAVRIISLGIGDTTEPISLHICDGLINGARRLGSIGGYSGYQDEGLLELREKISEVFYESKFGADEIFISDGAKCDIGRLQMLFGAGIEAVVQDPSYPVYVDGSVLTGAAGAWQGNGYHGVSYLPCIAENDYFPDLSPIPENSLIYFCSPNNPTGAVSTREQLLKLVKTALGKGCIIIFDAAYSEFIRDTSLPKSIFEIEGAEQCAIEIQSFSKPAGFTGVRLGWSVVPKTLKYAEGESINADWARLCGTIFNGASNIAQAGALAALDPDGLKEMRRLTDFYLGNAYRIKNALQNIGVSSVGGGDSPYIWAQFPGRDSWDVFTEILEKCRIVTTPGVGFGPSGQSFIRFSSFGRRADVEEACMRLRDLRN
jgi:LL-diaminopimelate aminotransferase